MNRPESTYTAFAGARRIAAGTLRDMIPILKSRFDADRSETVLVFEAETGRQVDFDLRGSLDDVLTRELPTQPRGPGRPRLGVASREISLLPRHWIWLEQQPHGISGALRRVLERTIRSQPGSERARQIRVALSGFLSSMAGNRPNYEEACRALYAGDTARFESLVRRWPADIREYVVGHAREAARLDQPQPPGESVVSELYRVVWSDGDYRAIERLVAPRYTIHSDPGDPWEGETLDRETYEQRVEHSRTAFPDLTFAIEQMVAAGDHVSVRWSAKGTHAGDLPGLPATGKLLGFAGQTIYELADGRVAGHWQVVDRLGFIQQLR
jgi:steroid delta-isomerase-like uncharacterized protein